MKKKIVCLVITLAFTAIGCSGYMKSNTLSQLFYGVLFSTSPALNSLVITATDSSSITLAQPTLLSSGNPTPTVVAYIGIDGVISVNGPTVSNSLLPPGPVDVSAGGYTFNGLSGNTTYRIIVVAQNSSGYSIMQIVQSTGGIAPVMDPLVITFTDDENITLQQPTFSTPGNPLPPTQTRLAYIGLDGVIAVTPLGVVSNNIGVSQDVSIAGCNFTGLSANTAYRIIVVASNASGVSMRQIVQITGPSAPVMDQLVISATDDENITLQSPTFSTPGNPLPAIANAYIGVDGTITVTPLGVVGSSSDGPYNVFAASHTFTGLTPNTPYRIIVVTSNASGVSVRQIVQITGPAAPVMSTLNISAFDQFNITLDMVTFLTPGNPVPLTADAYIGLDGTITVTPLGVVGSSSDGPYNVIAAGHTFTFLTQNTPYRIIVVTSNASGVSIRQIVCTTSP